MRRFLLSVIVMGLLMVGSSASATLTFTASTDTSGGRPIDSLSVGDLVTLNITLRSDGQAIRVLFASAADYDPGILAFRSGVSVNSVLSRACLPSPTGSDCFGGIYHELGGGYHPSDIPLSEDSGHPLGPHVKIFAGVAGFPFSSTGEIDVGVNVPGGGSAGGPQFQLVFEVVSAGSTIVNIGIHPEFLDFAGGPSTILTHHAIVSIGAIVPEPGTSLLVGIGLIALASQRPCSRKTRPGSAAR